MVRVSDAPNPVSNLWLRLSGQSSYDYWLSLFSDDFADRGWFVTGLGGDWNCLLEWFRAGQLAGAF